MNQKVAEHLKSISKPKILDLGCGKPTIFFNWDRDGIDFGYVGVDIKSEIEICEPAYDASQEKAGSLIFNSYRNRFEYQKQGKLKLKDFEQRYTFHFGTKIQDYLTYEREPLFDLIYLSNVLHKFDKPTAHSIFQKCLSTANANALIYVSVLTQRLKEEDSPYSIDDIRELLGERFSSSVISREGELNISFLIRN